MRFTLDDFIAVLQPVMAFFAVGFVLGVVMLILTRRKEKAGPSEEKEPSRWMLRRRWPLGV